ncbi:HFL087Cp [Eremothecium sinecaudum]|uniref:DNA repair protein RAD5 n=1 Tax=Eremothecium sinecaudum TaxID=45286 RepID=A0A0X8HUK5_9SACH|nr:HFL087Cp [Eremothecium sinecaudum]AMD21769.1 HFL087Cp [Eremothecium sinecaudum]
MTSEESDNSRPRFFNPDLEAELKNQDSSLFVKSCSDDDYEQPTGIDKTTFFGRIREVLGSIDQFTLDSYWNIYQGHEDGVSKAIQDYLDKTAIVITDGEQSFQEKTEIEDEGVLNESKYHKKSVGIELTNFSGVKRQKKNPTWKRFLGSIQVNAMATRPTTKPLEYGTVLLLKYTQGQPQFNSRFKKFPHSQYVRFYNGATERELGRLPDDIAEIVYLLLGSQEVVFKATMIFCNNRRLSVGDVFVVQLDCYITSLLFEGEKRNEFRSRMSLGRNGDSENTNEVRNRALMMLFERVNIKSVNPNDDSQIEAEVYDLEDETCIDTIASAQNLEEQQDYLNMNQLKNFYKIAQTSFINNKSELQPPTESFSLELRRYQKQGLAWMLGKEREHGLITELGGTTYSAEEIINPLWRKYRWPTMQSEDVGFDANVSESTYFYANLHVGKFSVEKPVIESSIRGGILADEMGLGKTISTLALICTVPYDLEYTKQHSKYEIENSKSPHDILSVKSDDIKPYAYKTTLVVVPMSLLAQWQKEFESCARNKDMRCEIYYGNNVSNLLTVLTKTSNPPTVLLTTYGIIQNEWRSIKYTGSNANTEGLFAVEYFRIVIDEGHTIRNRNTKTFKAILDLAGKRRWVLTGTPIINKLDDLYSLVKFLRLDPWSQIGYWKQFISDPFEKRNYKVALDVMQVILGAVMLRRTKSMRDNNGLPLVELPPKEVIVEQVQFNEFEDKLYKDFLHAAENSVNEGLEKGDLLKRYSTILIHILRLRQVCCHVKLLGSNDENDEDLRNNKLIDDSQKIAGTIRKIDPGSGSTEDLLAQSIKLLEAKYPTEEDFNNLECSICTSEPISPLTSVVFTKCCHSFCESCISEYVRFQQNKKLDPSCPNCRSPIVTGELLTLDNSNSVIKVVPYDDKSKSSKVRALLKHLKLIQVTSPGEQVVIFSQFSSYLDILEEEIKQSFQSSDVTIYKFDGRLALKERSRVLEGFKTKEYGKTKILLLSLKAGGVGLNLTCASRAFIMDPWWSPSMEDQAMDRVHRIGQSNSVKIVRFIMENSVEEKMLQLQDKKRSLGELVGADEDERKQQRIEEIQMLFK